MVAELGCRVTKLAEQAESYDVMVDYMCEVSEQPGKPELQKICDSIHAQIDKNLILSASMGEWKVSYCKTAENASVACAEATKVAERDLVMIHPIRLDTALNSCVFQYEVLQDPDEARETSQEQIQERTVEETIDVPVPQLMVETIEAVKLIPHDKVQKRTVRKIVDVEIPQIREEIEEMIQHFPQERIPDRVIEQIVDVQVPEIRDQIVDMPVPRIRDEPLEMIQLIPQDRISECIIEQSVDALVRQIREQIVKVVKAILKECMHQRTLEHIVDVSDPRIPENLER